MTAGRILRRLRAELRLSTRAGWQALLGLFSGHDFTHAAAIAYYTLLSLFPFLLLTILLLGSVAGREEDRLAVLTFVFRYFPIEVVDFVSGQLDALMTSGARLRGSVAGSLALVWASLGVFTAITSAVNEAWGVETQRNFWKHRLVSFLMLVAAGVVMVAGLLLLSAINVAQASWFYEMLTRFERLAALQTLTADYLATVLLILGVGLVFYFIPNARTRFRDVWVGAILTGVLWRLAFDGFSWYIRTNSRLTQIHGSLATVVIFLLWIYVCAIILMYGVEFTASYARLRRRRPGDMPAAPTPRT